MSLDIERAIKFLVDHQAQFDARMETEFIRAKERFAEFEQRFVLAERRFALADARMDRAEKRVDRVVEVLRQTNHVVAQLAAASLRARNELRQRQAEADREIKAMRQHGRETDVRLNALIDVVNKTLRRNGRGNGGASGWSNGKRGG